MANDLHIDEFWCALDHVSGGRVRLELDLVQSVFLKTFPHWQGSVDRREQLRALIDSLANAARLRLPRPSRSGWERVPLPALPKWVMIIRKEAARPAPFNHRTFPWINELSFIPSLRQLREATDALQIHEFLKNGGQERPVVPVKERSLELFGDEKRLDLLKSSQLFAPGRLSFEMLRCRHVPATLCCVPGSAEAPRPWLIVENEATFHSFCRLNAQISLHKGVILGSGNAVLRAAEFLCKLAAPTQRTEIMYFGDLDREGIDIPFQLHARVKPLGLIIEPADEYYLWTIDANGAASGEGAIHFPALTWFSQAVRIRVAAALSQKQRLAQEKVGWEFLCQKFNVNPQIPF